MMPPAQRRSISIGPDRAAADDDARRRAVVGDGVENLARFTDARIDDLHRRYHVFVACSTSVSPIPGPFKAFRE